MQSLFIRPSSSRLASSFRKYGRFFSTAPSKPPTAVVMLNMGGPEQATEECVGNFLHRLFSDREIIQLGPLQNFLGPRIAKRRTPRITEQYKEIGGSPIRKWTSIQGEGMIKLLDELHPETAPHKFYIAFRYADPLTESCVAEMKADGVTRAVAFSQYPQYSCTTAGSSLNELWRECVRQEVDKSIEWSVIDRWHSHPLFIQAVAKRIEEGLAQFPDEESRRQAIIVFSAHSLPMRVVNKGDPYPGEVAATANHVMTHLQQHNDVHNTYMLAWQSQVGPLPWLGPKTGEVIQGLSKQGHKNVLVVPIAFTSDHVETLYEIDIEYKKEAQDHKITNFIRAPSLNDSAHIIQAQADIVATHLKHRHVSSPNYRLNCPGCVNPMCRNVLNPIKPYSKLRDEANPNNPLAQPFKHIFG